MAVIDTVNRLFREFKRYTGDGLPGEPTGAPLPVGDPQSGLHNPKKSDLRAGFAEIIGDIDSVVSDATEQADRAEAAADAALAAVSGVISPKATVADAIADDPDVDPAYYDVAYFDTAYQTGSGAKYHKVGSEPTHPGKFQNANGTWYEIDAPKLRPQMFGECGTADDFDVFQAWAQAAVALKRPWRIPSGTYVLDGDGEIVLRTSGHCQGVIEIPKSNHTCRFLFDRDDTGAGFNGGTVLSTAAWDTLFRGKTDISAVNAAGKNLWFSSTETLMQRDGNASGQIYRKQEFVRCAAPNGQLSTALTSTYSDKSKLTVTAWTPSEPIEITGLHIRRTGAVSGTLTHRGAIVVWRDNVTLNAPVIIDENPTDPVPIGIEVSYCADVTINRPHIRGLNYAGFGYGIIFGQTIGCTVNDGTILDCRHAITGAHNADLHIDGGNYSYGIDDHWGDRMVVENISIHCLPGQAAISYSGNDLTVGNVKQFGGRSLVEIRNDTPNLGGTVRIKGVDVVSTGMTYSGAGPYCVFAFQPPGVGLVWDSPQPVFADQLVIEDVAIITDAEYVIGALLSYFNSPHTNWGEVEVRGKFTTNTALAIGISANKNANAQQGRRSKLSVTGPIDFKSGQAIYVNTTDTTEANGANCQIRGVLGGGFRGRPYAVNLLDIEGGTISSITMDGSEAASNSIFTVRGTRMMGGSVSSAWRNIAFIGCAFYGGYSSFPAAADVTMVGNTRLSGVTGLPSNIRDNVVAPFS